MSKFKSRFSGVGFLLLLGVVVAFTPQISWGQTGQATISGTVHDPSGASIPGVTVTAINKTTNVSYKAQTNAAGLYYIGALPIGPYTLMAEKQGFNRWQRDVVLEVNQNAAIDFAMEVGSTTTVVQVTGAPPVINTTGSEVGDVLDAQRINMLPLNGRSVGNLFALTPGVEGGAGGARVNGMKVGSLGITFDGVTERDRFGGGMVREQPDIQDVQEFAIDTSGDNARYADPATVTLKSKSGSNQLHGEAFETLLNATGALQARERQQTGVVTIPKEIRNEFGGNIGGPVVLPHIYNGHDKTFFYGSFEALRNISRSANLPEGGFQQGGGNTVPTLAMWNGDLSNAIDVGDGQPITIYNPYTTNSAGQRVPFAGNIVPSTMIAPIAKTFQSATQLPSNNNNPFIADNMTNVYPANQNNNNITAKVDQNFSDKDRLSVRWTRDTNANSVGGGQFGNPVSPSDGFGTTRENSSVTNIDVDYTRTISNSSLNELLLGVLRTPTSSGTLADFTNEDALFGLPNPFGVDGWPTVCAGCDYCWDGDNRKDEHLTTFHGEDNFTWVKGRHSITFGGSFSHEQNNVRELQQAEGSDTLGYGWTCNFDPVAQACATDTGDSFAGMLLGLPNYLSNQFNHGYYYFRQNYMAGYINDQWRVTSRLTFNLGVRWDRWTPYSEAQNRIDTSPLSTITQPGSMLVITPGSTQVSSIPQIPPSVIQSWAARGVTFSTADAFGYPSNLFGQNNHNFGPRLGAAYKINDKTVIRGGYGIFYWPMPLAEILQTSRSNPPLNLRFENDFLGPGMCGYGTNFNYTLNSAPAPGNLLPPAGTATVCTTGIVTINPQAQGIFPYAPNEPDDREQNWNISIERELPTNTTLRISYIGNHGSDLENRVSLNSQVPQITYARTTGQAPASNPAYANIGLSFLRPNPNWALPYGYASHTGFENGASIEAEVEHKYRSGVDFRWFYVYDHTLTNTDGSGFSDGNLGLNGSNGGGGGGAQVPEISQLLGQPFLTEQQLGALAYYNSTQVPIQHYGWNGVVDLPFGHGKKFLGGAHGPLDQLVGGWQVAFIGNWTTGFWESVNSGLVATGDPRLSSSQRLTFNYGGDQQQLWFRGNLNLADASNVPGGMQALTNLVSANPAQNVVHQFGPDCSQIYSGKIAVPLADGTCFNAPTGDFYNPSARGSILGPSAFSMDSSLYKNFSIRERAKIRFEADFFNVFNHPTNNTPNLSTGLIDLSSGQANNPRFLQFALHIVF